MIPEQGVGGKSIGPNIGLGASHASGWRLPDCGMSYKAHLLQRPRLEEFNGRASIYRIKWRGRLFSGVRADSILERGASADGASCEGPCDRVLAEEQAHGRRRDTADFSQRARWPFRGFRAGADERGAVQASSSRFSEWSGSGFPCNEDGAPWVGAQIRTRFGVVGSLIAIEGV